MLKLISKSISTMEIIQLHTILPISIEGMVIVELIG